MGATEGTDGGGAGIPRRLLGAASSALWLVGAVVAAWFLWPSSLGGCTTLTIVSGQSMEPTYYTGDLVVSRCGPPAVGDVVVYTPPDVAGARVIHRIVDGDGETGWILRGDNNDFLDPWRPTDDHVLGSSVLHLPHVGTFASILLSPVTWVSLLLVALAIVLWPGREDEGDEEDGQVRPERDAFRADRGVDVRPPTDGVDDIFGGQADDGVDPVGAATGADAALADGAEASPADTATARPYVAG